MTVKNLESSLPFSLISGSGLGSNQSSYSQIGSFLPERSFGDARLNTQVNLSNGNLFHQDRSLNFSDIGRPISFSYLYNSQDQKWRLAVGRKIEVENGTHYVIEADGHRVKYDYDANADAYYPTEYTSSKSTLRFNQETQTYSLYDPATRFEDQFSDNGLLKKKIDDAGNEINFEYQDNEIKEIIAPSGVKYQFERSQNKIDVKVQKLNSETEIVHSYHLDNNSNLLKSVTRDGYEINYQYQSNNTLANITQSDGTTLGFEFDDNNKIKKVKIGDDDSNVNEFSYAENVTTFNDAAGTKSSLTFDSQYHPVDFNQDGLVTSYQFSEVGQLEQKVFADGSVSSCEYANDTGLLTKKINRDGSEQQLNYSKSDKPLLLSSTLVSETKLVKQTTKCVYNDVNAKGYPQLTFEISPSGRVKEYIHDEKGLIRFKRTFLQDYFISKNEPTLADLQAWVQKIKENGGLVATSLTEIKYDEQGRLIDTLSYTKVDSDGNGILDANSQEVKIDKYDVWGHALETSIKTNQKYLKTKNSYNDIGQETGEIEGDDTSLQQETKTTYENNKTTITFPNKDLKKIRIKDSQGLLIFEGDEVSENNQKQERTLQFTNSAQKNIIVTTLPDHTNKIIEFYDNKKRIENEIRPTGAVIGYEYNDQYRYQIKTQFDQIIDINQLYLPSESLPSEAKLKQLLLSQENQSQNRQTYTFFDKSGQIHFELDADGYLTEYQYNIAGKLTFTIQYKDKITQDEKDQLLLAQDISRKPDRNKDRINTNFYDQDNYLIATQDPAGYVIQLIRDAAGRVTEKVSYDTPVLEISCDFTKILPLSSQNDGHYYYFLNGLDQTYLEVNERGYITETIYDTDGKINKKIQYATKVPETWNPHEGIPATPIPTTNDITISYNYDALGRLESTIKSTGEHTTYEYDDMDNVISEQTRDSRGLQEKQENKTDGDHLRGTQAKYNTWGQKIAVANSFANQLLANDPDQKDHIWAEKTLRNTFNEIGLKTKVTDSSEMSSLIFYDAAQRPIITIDPRGVVIKKELNAFGELTKKHKFYQRIPEDKLKKLEGGYVNEYLSNLLNEIADAKDAITHYKRDIRGQIIEKTDPEGNISQYEYDGFRQLKKEKLPVNSKNPSLTIEHEYEARGLETKTTKINNKNEKIETKNDYENYLGKPSKTIDPIGGETKFSWDKLGNLKKSESLVSGDQYILNESYQYDAFSRPVEKTNADNNTIIINYDQINLTTTSVFADGSQIEVTNNIFGEAVKSKKGNNEINLEERTFQHAPDGQIQIAIDGLGDKVEHKFHITGLKKETTNQLGMKTAFTYDESDNLKQTVVDEGNLNLTTQYKNNAFGCAEEIINPRNVKTTQEFDKCEQLSKSIVEMGLGEHNPQTEISYNAQGSIANVTKGDNNNPKLENTDRQYDDFNRLTKSTVDPNGLNIAKEYGYDQAGNVTKQTDENGYTTRIYYNLLGEKCFTLTESNDTQVTITEFTYTPGKKLASTRIYNTPIDKNLITDQTTINEIKSYIQPTNIDSCTYHFYDQKGRPQFTLKLVFNHITNQMEATVDEKRYDAADRVTQEIFYANQIDATNINSLTTDAIASIMQTLADPNNDRAVYRWYDNASQERLVINQDGRITEKQYDAAGNPIIKSTYYTPLPDPKNYLNKPYTEIPIQKDSNNDRTLTSVYDPCGRLQFTVRPNGQVIKLKYDENSNNTEICKFKAKAPTANSYQELVEKLKLLNPDPKIDSITKQAFYDNDTLKSITDALGATDQFERDALGRLTKHIDRENYVWEKQYDAASRLTDEISPSTKITQVKRNEDGTLDTEEIKDTKVITKNAYDNAGNIIAITKNDGADDARTVNFSYTKQGLSGTSQEAEINDPNNQPTDPSLKTLPTIKETLTTNKIYNSNGKIVAEQNVNGKWIFNVYDSLQRLTFKIVGKSVTRYIRNAFGEITNERRYDTPISTDLSPYNPQLFTPSFIQSLIVESVEDRIVETTFNRIGKEKNVKQNERFYFADGVLGKAQPQTNYDYNIFGDRISTSKLIKPDTWTTNHVFVNQVGEKIAEINDNNYVTVYDVNTDDLVEKTIEFASPLTSSDNVKTIKSVNDLNNFVDPNDPNNVVTLQGYDSLGQNTTITLLDETVQVLSTNNENHIPFLINVDVPGITTTKIYSKRQKETSTTYPDGSKEFKFYDERNNLIAETDVTRRNVFDSNKITPLKRYHIDAFNQVASTEESPGGCTLEGDNVPQFVDPEKVIKNVTLTDNRGLIIIKQDGEKKLTGFTYTKNRQEARNIRPVTIMVPSAKSDKGKEPEENSTPDKPEILIPIKNIDEVCTTYHDNHQKSSIILKRNGIETNKVYYKYNNFDEMIGTGYTPDTMSMLRKMDTSGRRWFTNEDNGAGAILLYDLRGAETLRITCCSLTINLGNEPYDNIPVIEQGPPNIYNRTERFYDNGGREIAIKIPLWWKGQTVLPSRQYKYDFRNNIIKQTDSLGNVTTFSFNKSGLLVKKISPPVAVMKNDNSIVTEQLVTQYGYNIRGHHIGEIDSNNHTTGYVVDEAGHQIAIVLGEGTVTNFLCFDAVNSLRTHQDSRGMKWQFEHDKCRNCISCTFPSGKVMSKTYDEKSNLASATDFVGNTTRYNCDVNNNVWESILPLGQTTRTTYYMNGLPFLKENPDGTRLTWVRDFFGHVLSYFDLSGAEYQYTYTFDMKLVYEKLISDRNVTTLVSDNHLLVEGNFAIVYFTPTPVRANPTYKVYGYAYDLLIGISDAGLGENTAFAHDSEGRITYVSITRGDGVLLFASSGNYDAINRLTLANNYYRSVFLNPINTATALNYDAVSNVRQHRTDIIASGYLQGQKIPLPASIFSFTYDAADRAIYTPYAVLAYQANFRIKEGNGVITYTPDAQVQTMSIPDVLTVTETHNENDWINNHDEVFVLNGKVDFVMTDAINAVDANSRVITSSMSYNFVGHQSVSATTSNVINNSNGYVTTSNTNGQSNGVGFSERINSYYIAFNEIVLLSRTGEHYENGRILPLETTTMYYDANRLQSGKYRSNDEIDPFTWIETTSTNRILSKQVIRPTVLKKLMDAVYHHHREPYDPKKGGYNACTQYLSTPKGDLIGAITAINNVLDAIYAPSGLRTPTYSAFMPAFPIINIIRTQKVPILNKNMPDGWDWLHFSPAGPSPFHTVAPGENFFTIAKTVYGNEDLATQLALDNGLPSPDYKIKPGHILTLKPIVNNHYKEGDILPYHKFIAVVVGNLSPMIKIPNTIKKHKKESGSFLKQLIKIIAVGIIIISAPYLSFSLGLLGSGLIMDAVMTGMTAAFMDAAYQGLSIAFNLQQDFSFSEMFEVGLAAGTGNYINDVFGAGISLEVIAKKALATAVTQVGSQLGQMATGERKKFDPNTIAFSVLETIIGSSISGNLKLPNNFAGRSLRSLAQIASSAVLGVAINGQQLNAQQIGANLLGAIVANELDAALSSKIDIGAKLAKEGKNQESIPRESFTRQEEEEFNIALQSLPSPDKDFWKQGLFFSSQESSMLSEMNLTNMNNSRAGRWAAETATTKDWMGGIYEASTNIINQRTGQSIAAQSAFNSNWRKITLMGSVDRSATFSDYLGAWNGGNEETANAYSPGNLLNSLKAIPVHIWDGWNRIADSTIGISTEGSRTRSLAMGKAIGQNELIGDFVFGNGPERLKLVTKLVGSTIMGAGLGAGAAGTFSNIAALNKLGKFADVSNLEVESAEVLANKAMNEVRVAQGKFSASSPNAAEALNRKYRALEGAQTDSVSVETLSDGRIKYYDLETPSAKPGPTRGTAYVTEYNPKTGDVSTYMESYDHLGNVNRIHPKMYNGQELNSPHYPPTLKEKLEAELYSSGFRR